ncbi:hypothetical protein GZ998_05520 [Actinomyces sp. 594]|uniref:hypothetical protein n=1 Tax=Actinomyces sp. 594 TaxID=2057793 RepID=UPI001C57A339|nr:hypothetical protein [Actinomyces sp. 594]MBW3068972.1 hypothetical protein [Actinomyces sp. 594]
MNFRATRDHDTDQKWPSFEEILNGGNDPATTQDASEPDTNDRPLTELEVFVGRCEWLSIVLVVAGLISYYAYHGAFTAREVSILLGPWAACALLMTHRSECGAGVGALAAVVMTAVTGCLLGPFYREITTVSPLIILFAVRTPLPGLRVPRRARFVLLRGLLLVGLLDVALVWAGAVGPWGLRGESVAFSVAAIIIAVSCRSEWPDTDLVDDVDQSSVNTWDEASRFVLSRVWICVEAAALLGLLGLMWN